MKWTEEEIRKFLTEKTEKWEPKLQKLNENWRLLFAYPMFIIVFMTGSCFNDWAPFFFTVTAVFVYIFVKNALRLLIYKKKIYMRIAIAVVLLIGYIFYAWHFFHG